MCTRSTQHTSWAPTVTRLVASRVTAALNHTTTDHRELLRAIRTDLPRELASKLAALARGATATNAHAARMHGRVRFHPELLLPWLLPLEISIQ